MDKEFSGSAFDLADEASSEGMPNPQKEQENELISFIDKLPHLNELDKYWARGDVEKELKDVSRDKLEDKLNELKKKYKFYDSAGKLRADICKRAPGKNGETVCNLIDSSILNISSDGKNRDWKLKELMDLDKVTKDWKKEDDLSKFMMRKRDLLDSVTAKIMMLFDVEFAEKFAKFQKEMGAPKFWKFSRDMSPALFPKFTTTFNFKTPRDFLETAGKKALPGWPKKIREALYEDAKEEILSSRIFDGSRENELKKIVSLESVADVVSKLLELKNLRDGGEKKMTEAEAIKRREENKEEDRRINEEKRKKQIEKEATMKEGEREKAKKKREEEEKREKEKEENRDKEGEGLSGEKKLILDFYNKSIEHAEKVIEECPDWGIDPKDIDFWGREGIKNRAGMLRKRGKWNDYVKFNSNDPNIPSNARGDGFRFRWLNVNTGSRISGAGADAGIKYMQRYKESGYMLCALAGGFSIDWAGSDSLTYTPVIFLEKMKALKSGLLDSGGKK